MTIPDDLCKKVKFMLTVSGIQVSREPFSAAPSRTVRRSGVKVKPEKKPAATTVREASDALYTLWSDWFVKQSPTTKDNS